MQVRPFRFVNESECAWLAELARGLAGDWAAHWLREPRIGTVVADPADRLGEDTFVREALRWQGFRRGSSEVLFVSTGASLVRSFAAMAFGTADEGADAGITGLAGEVFARAAEDLARRLLEHTGATQGGPAATVADAVPSGTWARAGGAVVVSIVFGGRPLYLLLVAPLVQRLLAGRPRTPRPRAPLTDPRQAIGGGKVRLAVLAGEAELDIGQFQSLSPGDVVPLAASIHLPLKVLVEAQAAPVRAFLGRTNGRKAIQLVPRHRDYAP